MNPRRYAMLFRRHWLTVAVFGALGLMFGEAHSLVVVPKYTARTVVYFAPASASSPADLVAGSRYGQAQAKSYAQLGKAPVVLKPVIEKYGLATSVAGLAGSVSATSLRNTGMVAITVTDSSPGAAASLANAVAHSLRKRVQKLSPRNEADQPAIKSTVIAKARPPTTASSPVIGKNLVIGTLCALLIGVAASLVRDRLDETLHSAGDVRMITPAPLLAQIPERRGPSDMMDEIDGYRAGDGDSMRVLRSSLRFYHPTDGPLVVAVTSAERGEECAQVALDLADVWSETSDRVLLIDTHHGSEGLSQLAQIDSNPGLTSVLIGDIRLSDAVQSWGRRGLSILPADPPQTAAPHRKPSDVASVLAAASMEFDAIVVHTQPVTAAAEAMEWMSNATGSLIVVRLGHDRSDRLTDAIDAATKAGVTVFGLVLKDVPRTWRGWDLTARGLTSWFDTRKWSRRARAQHVAREPQRSPRGRRVTHS